MDKYYTYGFWVVKKGKEDEFVEEWKKFADWTDANLQIKGYLVQDLEDPQTFISFRKWENKEDIDRWGETEELKGLMKKMNDICDKIESHTTILRVTSESQSQ